MVLTGENWRNWGINLFHCHFVLHESHMDLGANPGLRYKKSASNNLNYSTAIP
jgi:hypothetical protein